MREDGRKSVSRERTHRSWIGSRIVDVVALVLLVAGVSKLLDVPAFEDALKTWQFVPSAFARPAALIVPLVEVLSAGAWLLRLWPLPGIIATGGLLVVFSSFRGVHLVFAEPPKCGCFGPIQQFYAGLGEAEVVLVRNGVLTGLLILGVLLRRNPRGGSSSLAAQQPLSEHRCCGFTIVELMLCIAVLALVLALLLPALQASRREAQNAVSEANLRTHAQIFALYSADWREVFPYVTDPRLPETTLRVESRGWQMNIKYFEAFNFWNWGLADGYYGGDPFHPSFYPPAYWPAHGVDAPPPYAWSGYYLGCSFLADPNFWNPSTRTGQTQWRPVRTDEVLYPSRKGLLIAAYPLEADFHAKGLVDSWPDLRATFARVDSSLARVGLGAILPPMESGDGVWDPPAGYHGGWWFPILHTLDGARGRDIE